MPKYEVTRSYLVSEVCTLEAENENQARIMAMNYDGFWKEYDGDYLPGVELKTWQWNLKANGTKRLTTGPVRVKCSLSLHTR